MYNGVMWIQHEFGRGRDTMARTRKPRFGQAELDAAKAEGIATGREEGATTEHERIVAILSLPEAPAWSRSSKFSERCLQTRNRRAFPVSQPEESLRSRDGA